MSVKAVIFDIDGTLVDSNAFHVQAWEEAFLRSGVPVPREKIERQIGKGSDQLIPSLVKDVDERGIEKISRVRGEIFRDRYLKDVKAFPHATDLIKLLHSRGKSIVLASSAEANEVKYYAQMLEIKSMLTGIVSKADVIHSKPAGDIFAVALSLVSPIQAEEVLAVGDTPYDVQSALQSDIKTIAVRSGGFSQEILFEAGAYSIYAGVTEIYQSFDRTPLGG